MVQRNRYNAYTYLNWIWRHTGHFNMLHVYIYMHVVYFAFVLCRIQSGIIHTLIIYSTHGVLFISALSYIGII